MSSDRPYWWTWAHRHGVARTLNSRSNNMTTEGGAFIEAAGPHWLARRLALGCCRHNPLCRAAWNTIRVTRADQVSRFRWRFQFAYRRTA